jgi:hypothetical protein
MFEFASAVILPLISAAVLAVFVSAVADAQNKDFSKNSLPPVSAKISLPLQRNDSEPAPEISPATFEGGHPGPESPSSSLTPH